MFTRKGLFSSVGRGAAIVTVAAMALTAIEPSVANAAPAAKQGQSAGTSTATDISARRRVYRGGGGAAAAAAFAGIVGTGLAIAAAANRQAYYDDYYGGPYGAYAGPVYAPAPYYYGGYYGGGYRSGVPYFHGHPLAGW